MTTSTNTTVEAIDELLAIWRTPGIVAEASPLDPSGALAVAWTLGVHRRLPDAELGKLCRQLVETAMALDPDEPDPDWPGATWETRLIHGGAGGVTVADIGLLRPLHVLAAEPDDDGFCCCCYSIRDLVPAIHEGGTLAHVCRDRTTCLTGVLALAERGWRQEARTETATERDRMITADENRSNEKETP